MAHQHGLQSAVASRGRRLALTLGASFTLIAALSACSATDSQPSTTPQSSPSTTAVPSGAPPATLMPDGDAAANLPYFDDLANALIAANPNPDGRAVVDALVTGGFTKADMEVTFDRTSVDLAVDTLQWAVRWKGECLLGQTGPASGGYHGMVAPMLDTESCLVGATRPIDW